MNKRKISAAPISPIRLRVWSSRNCPTARCGSGTRTARRCCSRAAAMKSFAIGATCTHYGGPLAEGLLVDDSVRCPWHHACFSLRTGEPSARAGAQPGGLLARRAARRQGVCRRATAGVATRAGAAPSGGMPQSVVIVGGGAAGNAAAETLRREHYRGLITMLSSDGSVPCDRPNLSKHYLAGHAPEEWIPLRSSDFYREHDIDLKLGVEVTAIDTGNRQVELAGGSRHGYDALLLATGAEPVRLGVPGADLPHVHYLRTLADCRALIARLADARRAVVIGAGFIGLEAAASLRERNIDVHVVAPEQIPMERVLGPDLGGFLRLCTSSTASSSTSARTPRRSTRAASRSAPASASMPTACSPASASGR